MEIDIRYLECRSTSTKIELETNQTTLGNDEEGYMQ